MRKYNIIFNYTLSNFGHLRQKGFLRMNRAERAHSWYLH